MRFLLFPRYQIGWNAFRLGFALIRWSLAFSPVLDRELSRLLRFHALIGDIEGFEANPLHEDAMMGRGGDRGA